MSSSTRPFSSAASARQSPTTDAASVPSRPASERTRKVTAAAGHGGAGRLGEPLREGLHPGLAGRLDRRVVGAARGRGLDGRRRHDRDATGGRADEVVPECAADVAERGERALEHPVVLLGLAEDPAAAPPTAHEVHDAVDRAEPGVHAHRELEHVVAVGQVGLFGDDPRNLMRERFEASLVAAHRDDPRALAEQGLRHRTAGGARRARDQHGRVAELAHVVSFNGDDADRMRRVAPGGRSDAASATIRRDSRLRPRSACRQAWAAVMPTVDSMTGFIFLSRAS